MDINAVTTSDFYAPPVALLPTETLLEIFILSTVADDEDFSLPVQLTIGAVCSLWRCVAWGFPKLWCHIRLKLSQSSLLPILVTEWLERTASLPLDLSLRIESTCTEDGHSVLNRLLLQSKRWRSLRLEGRESWVLVDQINDRDDAFPELLDLTLDEGSVSQPSALPLRLSTSPLRKVRLDLGGDMVFRDDEFDFDWFSIRSLECTGVEISNYSILSEMSHTLTDLRLSFLNLSIPDDSISMPALQNLSLGGEGEYGESLDDNISLVAHLEVPGLKRLEITPFGMQPALLNTIARLIERSRCHLLDLTLLFLRFQTADLVELLRSSPSLLHVRLETVDSSLDNEFFEALGLDPGGGTETTILQNLVAFVYRGDIDFNPYLLRTCVEYRVNELESKLKSFIIHYTNPRWWADILRYDPQPIYEFADSFKSRGIVIRLEPFEQLRQI